VKNITIVRKYYFIPVYQMGFKETRQSMIHSEEGSTREQKVEVKENKNPNLF